MAQDDHPQHVWLPSRSLHLLSHILFHSMHLLHMVLTTVLRLRGRRSTNNQHTLPIRVRHPYPHTTIKTRGVPTHQMDDSPRSPCDLACFQEDLTFVSTEKHL